MTPPPEQRRRFGLVATAFAVLLLVVVLAALFSTCRDGGDGTQEQIAPSEDAGPAPGVE